MICDVEIRDAGTKGLGVFARRSFAVGEFIFRRRHAVVVDRSGVSQLTDEERKHLCELGWDRFAVLTPPGCYLNHSCEPSAMRSGVNVFAWRALAAGDEITIDYRLNAFEGDSWPCACGVSSCSGTVVGSFFALPEETQRVYLQYAPHFIRREYARRQRGEATTANTRAPLTMPP